MPEIRDAPVKFSEIRFFFRSILRRLFLFDFDRVFNEVLVIFMAIYWVQPSGTSFFNLLQLNIRIVLGFTELHQI